MTPSIAVYTAPGAGTPVQTFIPNTEYYVEFTVGSTGAPAGYGFQASVFANGSNAGTFIDCTSNAQLEDVGGRHIVELNDLSPSNTFGLYWGAPTGRGPNTFYASIPACNGAYGNSGDSTAARASRSTKPSLTSNAQIASIPISLIGFGLPNTQSSWRIRT